MGKENIYPVGGLRAHLIQANKRRIDNQREFDAQLGEYDGFEVLQSKVMFKSLKECIHTGTTVFTGIPVANIATTLIHPDYGVAAVAEKLVTEQDIDEYLGDYVDLDKAFDITRNPELHLNQMGTEESRSKRFRRTIDTVVTKFNQKVGDIPYGSMLFVCTTANLRPIEIHRLKEDILAHLETNSLGDLRVFDRIGRRTGAIYGYPQHERFPFPGFYDGRRYEPVSAGI